MKAKEDLDLHKLEVFYWVAELGSFSRAGDRLGLTQPTISAHIQELEAMLGSRILNRVGREVAPTPVGRVLFERAKILLAFKRETLAALSRVQGRIQGELLLGGSNIPGEYILPAKIGAFLEKYPEVKPILRIRDSAEIVQAVLDGDVEIGFIGFRGKDPRLALQKLWKDEMVLAASRNHPLAQLKTVGIESLRTVGFVSREGGSGTLRSFRELLAGKGHDPEALLNVTMELGSTEAIKQALITGLGVSILSKTAIEREVKDGLLKAIPIRGLKLERDFYRVVHRRRSLSPVARAFLQFLSRSLTANSR